MMESSRKLESLLCISFCHGRIAENILNVTSPLCQNVMGKQRLIWSTGDTFGIYIVYVIATFYLFPEYVFSGRASDWLLCSRSHWLFHSVQVCHLRTPIRGETSSS